MPNSFRTIHKHQVERIPKKSMSEIGISVEILALIFRKLGKNSALSRWLQKFVSRWNWKVGIWLIVWFRMSQKNSQTKVSSIVSFLIHETNQRTSRLEVRMKRRTKWNSRTNIRWPSLARTAQQNCDGCCATDYAPRSLHHQHRKKLLEAELLP